jgi:hypothetical protein
VPKHILRLRLTPTRISAALREQVRERAGERCEYCLLAEVQAFFPHEPDHIIAQKHGGESTLENLAIACFDCNRFKGSDIASVDAVTSELLLLFNPRRQRWNEHFGIRGRPHYSTHANWSRIRKHLAP